MCNIRINLLRESENISLHYSGLLVQPPMEAVKRVKGIPSSAHYFSQMTPSKGKSKKLTPLFLSVTHFSLKHRTIYRAGSWQVWIVVITRGYPVDHPECWYWCQNSGCLLLCKEFHPFLSWQKWQDVQQYWASSWHFELWIQKHDTAHS